MHIRNAVFVFAILASMILVASRPIVPDWWVPNIDRYQDVLQETCKQKGLDSVLLITCDGTFVYRFLTINSPGIEVLYSVQSYLFEKLIIVDGLQGYIK